MPVIDDPQSMIRCTNKVYLHELLEAHGVPVPPTVMLADDDDLVKAERLLGWPMVRQDSRRLVLARRAQGRERRGAEDAVRRHCSRTPTSCWRRNSCRPSSTGGSACSTASRCSSASTRWRAATGRSSSTGRTARGKAARRRFAICDAPPRVIDAALKAARAIGPGLYGVDIKETDGAIVVIEVNDNPNLEHGVEDLIGKDEIWTRILNWFIKRIDA